MIRRYRIRGGRPLRGAMRVPGDKSIGHRAIIFASLAEGRSTITGLSGGLDNLSTAQIFREMAVSIDLDDERARLLHHGVARVVVCKTEDEAGRLDKRREAPSLREVEGHRFVAYDVEAVLECFLGDRVVQVVGRHDRHEVHPLLRR